MPQPRTPGAASAPYPPRAGARPVGRKPATAVKKVKADKPTDSISRGALAGRIAAGAAIGSAAIAGALLFAGKIDGKTPRRVWDKVKPPAGRKQASPKKTG